MFVWTMLVKPVTKNFGGMLEKKDYDKIFPGKAAKSTVGVSITRAEIERFWRRKRMLEEEHLMAAMKAAARIKARTLMEEEYKHFEESLDSMINNNPKQVVGIKDWWTRSRFAYLNQPPLQYMDPPKNSYVPQFWCCYSPLPSQASFLHVH
ncbi:hypothetical protein AMTRI_Chr09g34800 [Amborella trichopoda]